MGTPAVLVGQAGGRAGGWAASTGFSLSNFKTMQDINMKLHRLIDLIKEKCSAQEP